MKPAWVFFGLNGGNSLFLSFQNCVLGFVAQIFLIMFSFSLMFKSSLPLCCQGLHSSFSNQLSYNENETVTSKPRHASAELWSLFSSPFPQRYYLENFLQVFLFAMLVGKTQGTQGFCRTAFCIKLTLCRNCASVFPLYVSFLICINHCYQHNLENMSWIQVDTILLNVTL